MNTNDLGLQIECASCGEIYPPDSIHTCAPAAKITLPDMVNAPPHYRVGGLECIDVIETLGLGYRLGSCLKYLWRAGRKGAAIEDLEKCRWYLDREIQKRKADERAAREVSS